MRDHRLTRPRPLPSSRKPLGIVPSAFCLRLVSHFIRLGSPRSGRQSRQNQSSYSPKPITRGTQTLHKGRSEIVPDKLKHSTRGANQIQSRRSDGKTRPSHRPIPPFQPQNPPHADFSFRPTDFVVQGNRLFGDPYRLFLLRLRGRSDESYGPKSARFPNFCRAASFLSHHSPRQGRSVPISKTFQGHSNTDTISSKHQRDFIEGRLDFIGTPLGLLLSLEPPRAPLASSDAPGWICQSPRLHFQKAEVGFDRASGWISRTLRLDFTGTAIRVNPSPRQG